MEAPPKRYSPSLQAWIFVILLFVFVLAPFFLFEKQGIQVTSDLLKNSASANLLFLLVIFGLMMDIFLPLPSTLIAATAAAALGPGWGFASVWLGLSAGCILGYEFAAIYGRQALDNIVKDSHQTKFEWLKSRYGLGAIVICRGIPVLAEVSVLLAGSAKVDRSLFYTLCFFANIVVSAIYINAFQLLLS